MKCNCEKNEEFGDTNYRLTKSMIQKIADFMKNSIYRMNAPTADGYSFTLYKTEKNKLAWQGGWVWGNSFDGEKYRMDFKDNKIYKNGVAEAIGTF